MMIKGGIRIGGLSVSGFNPASISGLALWLDGTTGLFDATSGGNPVTTDGSAIARWEDRSGNARHATQATALDRPVLKTGIKNGKNIVRFNATNGLDIPSIVSTDQTPVWIFSVNYISSSFAYRNVLNINQFAYFYLDPTSKLGIGRQFATDEVQVNYSINTWSVLGGFSERSGANTNTKIRVNQIETSITTASTGGTVFNLVGGFLHIGDIAEILVYNSSLSTEAILLIEKYLNYKWSVF
jgi:hypothetical protein